MTLQKIINETLPVLPDKFSVLAQSETIRTDMLAQAGEFKIITSPVQANSAGESARSIQTLIATVEEMGLAYRRPLAVAAKLIKSREDEYLTSLKVEKVRLELLIKNWTEAERRRVEEEERKRQLEIQRLENLRIEAERKANEARARMERENREAEERARIAEAKITDAKELEAAIAAESTRNAEAAERQRLADIEAEKVRAAAAAQQAAITAPLPEAHKVAGMPMKKIVRHIVTDERLLLKNRPDLFKCEIKKSALVAVCFPSSLEASEQKPDTSSIPGLTMYYELDVNTRKW